MRRAKHALKKAIHRQFYVLVLTSEYGWVRAFHFGPDDWLMIDLDNNPVAPQPLTDVITNDTHRRAAL